MCEKVEQEIPEWCELLVPRLAKTLRKKVDNAKYDLSVPKDAFYLSNTYYLTISFHEEAATNGKDQTISLVVKKPPEMEIVRKILNADNQFHNEILFYEKFGKNGESCPRCFYAHEEPPLGTVIALENINKRGYEGCPKKFDVPLEYTLTAMQEIGRFHGKAYVMKEKRKEEFFDIVSNILETRYEKCSDHQLSTYINLITPRSIDYLRQCNYDKVFCDKMNLVFENAYENIMLKAVEPVEPLATLCHGDFTANNMLFRRDENGLRVMLIDFALLRYSTPTIDLSTYLCLCCSNEIRRDKFTDIFNAYYDSLRSYLEEHGIEDLENYSYEALMRDYKERALFGFVIASFFLPTLMGKVTMPTEEVMKLDIYESSKITRESGGDEMSRILADMLLDLKDRGCLEHLL